MAEDLLTEDEVDALLSGGADDEGAGDEPTFEEYDFTNKERALRGRVPPLATVNERFARFTRLSILDLLRCDADVSVGAVQVMQFSEYVHSLYMPSSMSLVRMSPLRGTSLIVMEAKLVLRIVDHFFGGDGRNSKIDGRDFTPVESRVVRRIIDGACRDLTEAWRGISDVQVSYLGHEVNPSLATIVSAAELVLVSRFNVETPSGGGEMHVTVPYTMLEPVREQLEASVQGALEVSDEDWGPLLHERINDAPVSLNCTLGQSELTIGQLLTMKAGDVIPMDMGEVYTVRAGGVPVFRATLGESRGNLALKIQGRLESPFREKS